ncbi:MAG TPA: hypothetical protein VG734_05720 [Lacunisphaera sp.]|nr:hypothetical protein [Lacunisphaera sp.]
MSNPDLPQASVIMYPEFGAAQTKYFLASLNLLFVLTAGGLMYFYALYGTGVAADGMTEDLLVVLIRTFCTLGGVGAGAAWLHCWMQLQRAKSE